MGGLCLCRGSYEHRHHLAPTTHFLSTRPGIEAGAFVMGVSQLPSLESPRRRAAHQCQER